MVVYFIILQIYQKKNIFQTLSSFLAEQKPLLSADYPSHKDVISLDSDEEEPSDNGNYHQVHFTIGLFYN